jgi:hypothetical protein
MITRPALALLFALLLLAGCSAAPRGAYFPPPADPATVRVSHALHRAVVAAGDDPERYSFAFVASPIAVIASDEEATIYVTDGLARQPLPVVEAAIAHEIAHEVLGHAGTRRALALSMSAEQRLEALEPLVSCIQRSFTMRRPVFGAIHLESASTLIMVHCQAICETGH